MNRATGAQSRAGAVPSSMLDTTSWVSAVVTASGESGAAGAGSQSEDDRSRQERGAGYELGGHGASLLGAEQGELGTSVELLEPALIAAWCPKLRDSA